MNDQDENLQRRLLGTWKLVSAVREEIPSGRKTDFFGPDPVGYLTYSPEGRMFALIVRGDRKRPKGAVAAPSEIEALFKSAVSYTGKFTVEGNEVIHYVDASMNEAWTGTVQRRTAAFENGRLALSTPPSPDPLDGLHSVRTMTWERA
ncbi:MAG TPA: lipocalin-like domain-containing protein [Xanthobacteraceae bacterium]